ncbi:MAG: hypothetical protein V1808_02530 [Candidatus Daviesbacteria bacterium]
MTVEREQQENRDLSRGITWKNIVHNLENIVFPRSVIEKWAESSWVCRTNPLTPWINRFVIRIIN